MKVGHHSKMKNARINRNATAGDILRTKLQRPAVAPDILPRARVFDLINEGRQRTLTLISAPAGYGKSTLASRWVAACNCPSGWVSLDESDNEPRMFLSYVLAAIESLFPEIELQTKKLLEASQLPSPTVLARQLLNDLQQITEPFVLVLDDFHRIHDPSILDLVAELLRYPPANLHLVLLTRHDPSLPLATLRGRGQINELRVADLRFTCSETGGFLSKLLKVPVDENTAALLEEKTEGWVTGLRLIGISLRGQDDLKQRVQELSGSSQHITEYLLTEILAKQTPDIAQFLAESSILDRFCAPLCQALCSEGNEKRNEEKAFDAQRFIEWLVESNLFIIPLDDQGYWFRYHHLFQDFLQTSLRRQTGADTVAELHKRASKWFAENGLIEESIYHALAAGDAETAVQLVIAHRYDLLNTCQFPRLSRWMRSLPADAILENPLLMMTQAFLGLAYGPDSDAYTYTEQARQKADVFSAESPDSSTVIGEIAVLQSVQDVILGKPASAFANAQKAMQLLPQKALYCRSLALGVIAASRQMKGDCRKGVKVLRDALTEIEWPLGIRTRMLYYLCIINFLDANSSGVLWAGRECLGLKGSAELIQPRSNAQFYLGAIHYLRNEVVEARRFLTDIVTKQTASEAAYVIQASGILGFIHLAEGCPEEAERIIESVSMESWHMQDGFALTTREALLVEFALRQGKVDEARRLSVHVDFDLRPPHWFLYVPQLTHIKLLLAEGTEQKVREARNRLSEIDEQMSRINRKNVRIDVLVLLALVCHKQGAEAEALKKLQDALTLAEPAGWVRNFVDLGTPMTDLLERLNQTRPGHTFTKQVLDACRAQARINALAESNGKETSLLSEKVSDGKLTRRETEILTLLAQGCNNKEISTRLFIAQETVKTHLQNLYSKLDVPGRFKAIKRARDLGYIPQD